MQEMDLLHLLSSLFEEELDAANSSVSLYEVPLLLSPKLGGLWRGTPGTRTSKQHTSTSGRQTRQEKVRAQHEVLVHECQQVRGVLEYLQNVPVHVRVYVHDDIL